MLGSKFVSLLPANESPETTDGREGYFWVSSFNGNPSEAKLKIFLRDFEQSGIERRVNLVHQIAKTVESSYPGSKVTVVIKDGYNNMVEVIKKDIKIVEFARKAYEKANVKVEEVPIRGGTDGSELSIQHGIPTPNLFTGGHNYHSKREFAALSQMVAGVEIFLNLADLWKEEQ